MKASASNAPRSLSRPFPTPSALFCRTACLGVYLFQSDFNVDQKDLAGSFIRDCSNREIVKMASDIDFVTFVVDQIRHAGPIRYRKMFGEYAIYCREKVVALICDDQLFVKPTKAGRAFIGNVIEAPAYPGARPSFLIEDQLEDGEWLSELIALTERELPDPKPKKKGKG